jgi:BirA family biotin operon repressor/biotin-[acetyl-CoA-carboxylase] ligase
MDVDQVDSTNSMAAATLLEKKLVEGTAITAQQQSHGRGYAGSDWQSEYGKNLLLSIVLYPVFLAPRQQFFLNQVASLAVADLFEQSISADSVRIKWPNDVLINERKSAGILIENSVKGNLLQQSIVGLGININQQHFPASLRQATSLSIETGQEYSCQELMQQLFIQIEKRYLQLKENRMEILTKDYMKRLYRVDEPSFFSTKGKEFTGIIRGLTAEGKLVVEQEGTHRVYGFKEIEMKY